MSYAGWTIAPHKIQSHPSGPMMIHFYYVIDENEQVYDRLNAVYDGDGDIAIYSHNEEGFIDPWTDDPYLNFLRDELNAHRIIQDALHSIKSPVDSNGIIWPWNIKK